MSEMDGIGVERLKKMVEEVTERWGLDLKIRGYPTPPYRVLLGGRPITSSGTATEVSKQFGCWMSGFEEGFIHPLPISTPLPVGMVPFDPSMENPFRTSSRIHHYFQVMLDNGGTASCAEMMGRALEHEHEREDRRSWCGSDEDWVRFDLINHLWNWLKGTWGMLVIRDDEDRWTGPFDLDGSLTCIMVMRRSPAAPPAILHPTSLAPIRTEIIIDQSDRNRRRNPT